MRGVRAQAGPGGGSADIQTARQAMRDGHAADAAAAARRELQSHPASTDAAAVLDVLGLTSEAKPVFQRAIDAAADPLAKSVAERGLAMSYAFDGDCAGTVKYEQLVIDYWVTRERAEPQNAFYQEGEMADEAARVCLDAGDLKVADQWYRKGDTLGLKEPAPKTHPKSLWEFRLAHAMGRIAARQGDAVEGRRQVQLAKDALDSDPAMAAQQARFLPYLEGYVALYTKDLKIADLQLTEATSQPANATDPFMVCLLAMTYEQLGQRDEAHATYEKAFGLATAHNPGSAFTRRYARAKLGLTIPS